MEKLTHFLGHTEQGTFAQGLFSGAMEKTAGVPGMGWDTAPAIRSFISTIKPEDRKKKCYVLVTALGAGEYYGSNINADYFPWEALTHEGDEYGYQTFLNAHAFAHHVNKDPLKAFGIPVVSVLNPRMRRVELVIALDREKAQAEGSGQVIDRIDDGEFPDVSMGCKVPFDICSICGHRSKTRKDYCEHMSPLPDKKGIWGPNRILADGRKIYVINTLPRFFDISFVFIGADRIAKTMAKLASKGNQLCLGSVCALPATVPATDDSVLYSSTGGLLDLGRLRKAAAVPCNSRRGPCGRLCAECADRSSCDTDKLASAFGVKSAAQKKLSDIVKRVPAQEAQKLPELEAKEKDFPKEVLDYLASYPLANSTGAATQAGVVLKPHEFQRIVLVRMGETPFADELDRRRLVFRPTDGFDDRVDPELPAVREIVRALLPYLMARSSFSPALRLRSSDVGATKRLLPTRDPIEHSVLDKVSAAYNGYRRNILTKLSQVRDAVLGDPQLMSKILGDGLVTMFSKTASETPFIGNDTVTYMTGAHLSNRSLLTNTTDDKGVAVATPWLREELPA